MPFLKMAVCMGPWDSRQLRREGRTSDNKLVTFVLGDTEFKLWRWKVTVPGVLEHGEYAATTDEARASLEEWAKDYFDFIPPVREQLAQAKEKIVALEARVSELEQFKPKFKLGDRVTLQGGEVVHRVTKVCSDGVRVSYAVSNGQAVWSEIHLKDAA